MGVLPESGEGYETPKGVIFDEETCHFVVDVDPEMYGYTARAVRYNGKTFQPKDELHITILSNGTAEALKEHLDGHPGDFDLVQGHINHTGWVFKKEARYYHVVEDPGMETIIQMVEVQALDAFLESLAHIIGRELPKPPTHVTLYTMGVERGIALPDQETFDRLVQEEVSAGDIIVAEHKDT